MKSLAHVLHNKLPQKFVSVLAMFAMLSSSFAPIVAFPAKAFAAVPTTVCSSGCDFASLQDAVDAATSGDTISINSDLSISSQVTIAAPLTILGNGHTITPTFTKTDNSNNASIGINGTSGVTISNLTIDGTSGTNLHGINVFDSNNITLTGVTVENNDHSGLNIVSSDVTVDNITTKDNGWHGIDVDLSAGTVTNSSATLTVTGVSIHKNEIGGDIYVDDTTKDVSVVDTNDQYTVTTPVVAAHDAVYTLTPSASDSSFTSSTEYIRSHNTGDVAAIALVPAAATAAHFTYTQTDGSNVYTDVAGMEHLQSGQFPVPSTGQHQYRGYVSAEIGTYAVTGEFEIGSNWFPITGAATVYVLGAPTGSFIIPSVTSHIFRPSDNPVRVSADDANDSFKSVTFNIDSTNYTVNRAQCDLREAGNRILCDVRSALNWGANLAEGTYTATATLYNQANNHSALVASDEFTIDATRPALSNFVLDPAASPYDTSVDASADATDANGIKNVTFSVTAPRAGDAVCTGNGTPFTTAVITATSTGTTYAGTLDLHALSDGDYCVNAVAEDVATNHSAAQSLKITIVHPVNITPTLIITAPASNGDTVSGTYTFMGEYDNGVTNSLDWAVRTGTSCSNSSGTVFGNVDGHHDGSVLSGADFSTNAIDTSIWNGGQYCFVINDLHGHRSTRIFTVDNTPVPTPSVTTDTATNITASDATLNGTNGPVDASGESFWVSTSTFDTSSPHLPANVWSTPVLDLLASSTAFSDPLSIVTTNGIITGGVNSNMSAITPNTTYYYVAWVEVADHWYPGAVQSFTTGAGEGGGDSGFTPPNTVDQISQIVFPADLSIDTSTWYFYDDFTDTPSIANTSDHRITTNPVTLVGDTGAVELNGSNGNRMDLATVQYTGTKLADIAQIGYSTYQPTDNLSGTNNAPFLGLDINFATTTVSGYQGRLNYVPGAGGNTPAPVQGSWQSYEGVASNGDWSWSHFAANGNKWPDGNTTEYRTWNDIVTAFPDAMIAGQLAIRAGDPYESTFMAYIDHVYLATSTSNVSYNFEVTSTSDGSGGSGGGGGGSGGLLGDINHDGHVDILDLVLLMAAYGQTGTNISADLNHDNAVDMGDLIILLAHWTS